MKQPTNIEDKLIDKAETIQKPALTGTKSYGQIQRNKVIKQVGIKSSFTGKRNKI